MSRCAVSDARSRAPASSRNCVPAWHTKRRPPNASEKRRPPSRDCESKSSDPCRQESSTNNPHQTAKRTCSACALRIDRDRPSGAEHGYRYSRSTCLNPHTTRPGFSASSRCPRRRHEPADVVGPQIGRVEIIRATIAADIERVVIVAQVSRRVVVRTE